MAGVTKSMNSDRVRVYSTKHGVILIGPGGHRLVEPHPMPDGAAPEEIAHYVDLYVGAIREAARDLGGSTPGPAEKVPSKIDTASWTVCKMTVDVELNCQMDFCAPSQPDLLRAIALFHGVDVHAMLRTAREGHAVVARGRLVAALRARGWLFERIRIQFGIIEPSARRAIQAWDAHRARIAEIRAEVES